MKLNLPSLLQTLSKLSEDEMNDILDTRDKPEFENFWLEVDEKIIVDHEFHPDQQENFIKISNVTKQHEITSYISDDLDLIYMAKKQDLKMPFLEYLESCYEKGVIPCRYKE